MDCDRRGLLILFPGALGDFLCALPSFYALRRANAGTAALVANPAALELVAPHSFQRVPIHRREVADLFGEGQPRDSTHSLFGGFELVHSWTGHDHPGFAERLRLITGAKVHVHRFRGMLPSEHASDYYARCAGLQLLSTPLWITAEDESWAHGWHDRNVGRDRPLLLVHPGSGSQHKNWEGFPSLLTALLPRWEDRGGRLAVLLGPAETEHWARAWAGALLLGDLGLRQIAALLRRTTLYVGNDSGISHLAALVRTPSVVLFGPSDPGTWAPRSSSSRVVAAARSCLQCGPNRFCRHRLPVETVLAVIEDMATPRHTYASS